MSEERITYAVRAFLAASYTLAKLADPEEEVLPEPLLEFLAEWIFGERWSRTVANLRTRDLLIATDGGHFPMDLSSYPPSTFYGEDPGVLFPEGGLKALALHWHAGIRRFSDEHLRHAEVVDRPAPSRKRSSTEELPSGKSGALLIKFAQAHSERDGALLKAKEARALALDSGFSASTAHSTLSRLKRGGWLVTKKDPEAGTRAYLWGASSQTLALISAP